MVFQGDALCGARDALCEGVCGWFHIGFPLISRSAHPFIGSPAATAPPIGDYTLKELWLNALEFEFTLGSGAL